MPDKLSDNEIIKALECCQYAFEMDKTCDFHCPMRGVNLCQTRLIISAFSLINRQKAEIEVLEMHLEEAHIDIKERLEEIDMLDKNLCDAEAEIEDVKRRCDVALPLMERKEECIKAEAIKEFAEMLKTEQSFYDGQETRIYLTEKDLDNLVKEMVGEDK